MQIIRPNDNLPVKSAITVFLAGGCTSGGWRDEFFEYIKGFILNSLVLFDPYNANIKNNTEQIKWEVDRINEADIFSVYFDKYTDQPISMLELGKMFELAKDKCVHIETPLGKTAVYTQYGKPLVIGIHPDAPKKWDILIQAQLAGFKADVCAPTKHAQNIITAYESIRSQMK